MKYAVIVVMLFSFLLLSCGGDVASNENNDQQQDTIQIDSAESDTIDITNTDSLVVNYIRLRHKFIRDNEGAEVDVHIEGSYFDHRNDFYIFNFTEDWGIESIQYAVVTNSNLKLNQVLQQKDSNFGELGSFLGHTFPESTSFYLGNFEAAPAYQIVDYTSVLLTSSFNRNTYYEATSQLYFLTSGLEPQPVFANTMGYDGECDHIKGYQEKFALGKDEYRIVIEREEYGYDESCELLREIKYKKVWLEANLLNMSEGGPGPNVPTYFITDFAESADFKKLPRSFTQLSIEDKDTVYNDKLFKVVGSQMGNEKSVFVDESDYFSASIDLMIGFRKEADSSFTIFKRSAGINGDHFVGDAFGLKDSEQDQSFTELNIKLIDPNKGIYLFTAPDRGNGYLYTTKTELFKEGDYETDL